MKLVRKLPGVWLAVVLMLSLALPSQLLADRTKLKPGFNLFSKQQDVDLGKEASQQVSKEVPLLNDARVDRYLQKLGQKLAARSLAPDYPYTFHAVNSNEINAFALPGGPIYINRGVIENADDEAQLAGVMAHEITHVALRHGTNQLSKAMPAALLGQLLAGALGGGGLGGQLAQMGIGLGINSVLLKYSRDAERQADLGGTQILYDTGYNPHAMAQFFEKIKKTSSGGLPEFFSNHPDPGNREKMVETEVHRMGERSNWTNDSAEFREIKKYVQGLPRPPKAGTPQPSRGGAARPDPPSRRAQVYRGQGFQIHYPDNWAAFPDQDGLGVLLAPERGVFQDERGQGQIAYGTIVRYFRPHGQPQDLSLEEATRQLIQQIQAANPVRVMPDSERRLRVDGQPALSYYLVGQSPVGGDERDWLVASQRGDNNLLYVIFIAPESDFSHYEPAFKDMLSGLRAGPQ